MAQLPQPSNQISVSQINALKGLGNVQTSLRAREQQYMGGNSPARPQTSGVCMPNDVVTVVDPVANTGTIAQNSPTTWTYSGPGSGPSLWTPHSMKEFHGAYNGIPGAILTKAGTGSSSSMRLSVTVFGEFAGQPTPSGDYFFAYRVGAGAYTSWFGIPGPSTAFSGNPILINTGGSGNNPAPVTITVAVKDHRNCGVDQNVVYSIVYP